MKLRDYQLDSIQKCLVAYKSGSKSVLMELATGGGKTLSAIAMADSLVSDGERVLWTCHRKALIDQAKKASIKLGVDPRKFVFMVDKTAARKIQKGEFALTVFDEAHRSANATQQKIWEKSTKMLGLSATPIRLDKTPLDDQYDKIVFGVKPSLLIAEGSLSHYVVEGNSEFDRNTLTTTEYCTERELLVKCKTAIAPQQVLDCYLTNATAANHTIVFVPSIEFCEELTTLMRASGISAVQAHSKDPSSEANLAAFGCGDARVLVNVDMATEGYDVSSIDLVICARVTTSLSLWIQIVGRVLRRHPGKELGRVIDLTDNYRIFGVHNGIDIDDIDWEAYMSEFNKKGESGDPVERSDSVKDGSEFETRDVSVELHLSATSGLLLDDLVGISPERSLEIQRWLSDRVGWHNCDRGWLLSEAASLGEDYTRVIKRRLGLVN